MKALILAAGEGRRLLPLTSQCPKPLLPLGERSILEHSLALLHQHGVREVAINLHYLADAIPDKLGDGSQLGLTITYSREPSLLGSAGAAKRLQGYFDGRFFVLYGDVVTNIDLGQLEKRHATTGAIATIALYEVDEPERCGIVEMSEDGRVTRVVEKPSAGEIGGNLANAGIYCLEPEALELLEPDEVADFGFDLFPRLIESGHRIMGYPSDAYVIDVGAPDRYRAVQEAVRSGELTPAWSEP